VGTKVVMVPNEPSQTDPFIGENHLKSSKFRSSGYDGFMQDYVFLNHDGLIELPDQIDMNVAAFTEFGTIAVHSLSRLETIAHPRRYTFCVWGDGSLRYISRLTLKQLHPNIKAIIFGKPDHNLHHFSFRGDPVKRDEMPVHSMIDHAVECAA